MNIRYNTQWLRFRNPSDEAARKRRREIYLKPTQTWDKKEIEQRLKKFDYFDVLNNPKVYTTLHFISSRMIGC